MCLCKCGCRGDCCGAVIHGRGRGGVDGARGVGDRGRINGQIVLRYGAGAGVSDRTACDLLGIVVGAGLGVLAAGAFAVGAEGGALYIGYWTWLSAEEAIW